MQVPDVGSQIDPSGQYWGSVGVTTQAPCEQAQPGGQWPDPHIHKPEAGLHAIPGAHTTPEQKFGGSDELYL